MMQQPKNTDIQTILSELKKNGFARLNGILTSEQIQLLQEQTSTLATQSSYIPQDAYKSKHDSNINSYDQPPRRDFYRDVIYFIGWLKPMDMLFESLLSHPATKQILSSVLGTNYKISTCAIRIARAGCRGLEMHQDTPGEFSFAILVNDHDEDNAGLGFVPKSLYFPYELKKMGVDEKMSAEMFGPFFKSILGRAGDICMFFNTTWHGVLKIKKPSHVILLSFFGEGHKHKPYSLPNTTKYGEPFLGGIGHELTRLFHPTQGFSKADDGTIQVATTQHVQNRLVDYAVTHKEMTLSGLLLLVYTSLFTVYWHALRMPSFKIAKLLFPKLIFKIKKLRSGA